MDGNSRVRVQPVHVVGAVVCQVSRVDQEWLQDHEQAPGLQRYVRA